MGEPGKLEKPATPALIEAKSAAPAFDFMTAPLAPGGNSVAALGQPPMPATMRGTPIPWFLPPPALMSHVTTPVIGSFVLDPALADRSTPDGLDVHVLVAPTPSVGELEPARYVVIERAVRDAMRLDVFAVRLDEVYETAMEAFTTRPMISLRSSPLPTIQPGATYWTSAGSITALGVSGDVVFTAAPNGATGAAGSVILLRTDANFVLIDVGMQTPDATLASAVGDELARMTMAYLGAAPIGEAILSRRGPDGHVLPYIARQMQILSVRGTLDQYQDGSIGAVLAVQLQYRDWYLASLRKKLVDERASWEASQPIAPNDSIREQRWQQHLESSLASALASYQSPALAVAENAGAFLRPRDETPPIQAPSLKRDATGAVDLTDLDWEPADDEHVVLLGGQKLGLFPARGMVWRPATVEVPPAPTPARARSVPDLRAPGTLGPAPAPPRAVTAWLYLWAIGKEGQLLVRLRAGYGVLVDAGGIPRVVALDALAAGQAALGVEVAKILITHPHTDHVRHVIELIRTHNIEAKNLVVSKAWERIGLIKILKTTTAQDLVDLGYGEKWKPVNVADANAPISKLTLTVEGRTIDVYALPDKHRELAEAIEAKETDPKKRKSKVPSEKFDSASFMYVIGNESSPARLAVFGDLRGADILALQAQLTPDGFKAALKDVRVVYGLGHHLSQTAGRTATDVRGLDALIEATLHQNGELVLVVQSTDEFAFRGEPTTAGEKGALLRYLVRQGARVAFSGKAGTTPSVTQIDSNVQVSTQGPSAHDLGSMLTDPRVVDMLHRLELLREAQRTVRASPEFGPLALGLDGHSAAEIDAALQREIDALVETQKDLRALAGKELLEARAGKDKKKRQQQERERHRQVQQYVDAQQDRPPKLTTEAEILDAMTKKGATESKLSSEVLARLNHAVASGVSIAFAVEFAAVPRTVTEALEKLTDSSADAEQKKALAEKYRLLAELTANLDENKVPEKDRLEILQRVKELRAEVQKTLARLSGDAALQAELQRLDTAIAKLEAQTETVADKMGRDVHGRLTRTRYIKVRNLALESFGRGMGALMVIHSVEEAYSTLQGGQGPATMPQVALGLTHSVAGMKMGLKMMRGLEVGAKEFGFMAVLEVGMAAAGDYDTRAERAEAITNAAIKSAANLGCMALGQGVIEASVLLPPPFDLIGIGVGIAIMFAGDFVLDLFGFKEHKETPPEDVLDVGKKIDGVLTEYKAILGSGQLSQRPEEELEALGAKEPNESIINRAAAAADERARAVASKELELTAQFEEGYRAAKGSWFGMQYLDQKAAEFTKLRGLAFQGREDPNREQLDARWRAMDTNVRFTTKDEPFKLEQWSELSRKLKKIGDLIKEKGDNVDRKKLAEAVAAADQMLENARYRLDPKQGGELRLDPVIDDESGASVRLGYTTMLAYYEEQLSGYRRELVRLGGASGTLPFDYTIAPKVAYERLRSIRQMYETRVMAVSALVPDLAKPSIWEDPAKLTHTLEEAHYLHKDQLANLQLLDATLLSASHQATSSLRQFPEDSDKTLENLIKDEIGAATKAIEQRQYKYGLIFDGELDAILAARGTEEDKILAAQIDLAFTTRPADAGAPPHPFTEYELAALQSGSFGGANAKLTSTEAQLTYLRDSMAKLKGQLMFMNRFVDRQYFILDNPFRQWDDDAWFVKRDWRHYSAGLTPIVAKLVDHMTMSSLVWGVFADVAPLNADAVSIIGKKTVQVNVRDLTPLTQSMIVEIARKKSGQ